jgi:hypothetical protein
VGRVTRRFVVALGVLLVVAAGALAGGLLLAFGASDDGPTQEEYVARINAICQTYGRRLDKVEPPDLAIPAAVSTSIGLALPIVEQQAKEARAVEPPAALKADVDRFFSLNDRSIAALREIRHDAGEPNLPATADAWRRFRLARDAAKGLAKRLEFHC